MPKSEDQLIKQLAARLLQAGYPGENETDASAIKAKLAADVHAERGLDIEALVGWIKEAANIIRCGG